MSEKTFVGNALQNPKYKTKVAGSAEIAGAFNSAVEGAAHNDRLNRFAGNRGHGYAAERENDLIDTLHGHESKIIGDNNAKDGADRMVDGDLIQTKYCQTAQATVNAAFKNGEYRYYADKARTKPMQLEVPSDQYNKAVEIMRKRIADGKVPGITDPNYAKRLVRKGNIDYKTACNVAKAGNIDSLTFDAAHGAVIATSAFGISALITFSKAMWDGEPTEKAIDLAMYNGLKMGGIAFATSVISAQLTRTSLNSLLMSPSIELVKFLPSSVRHSLVNVMRSGTIYGGAATNNLAKLVRSNAITSTVVILAMSAEDITECFNGRISGKQLFKNVATLALGIGTGYAGGAGGSVVGATIGTLLLGPGGTVIGAKVGAVAGGIAGGSVGGSAAHAVMNEFIEDDAVEMLRIINQRLEPLVQSYLLNKEELCLVIDELKVVLEKEKLLQMFASDDRNRFADNMIIDVIEKIICWRSRIILPTTEEFIKGIGRVLELSSNKAALAAHFAKNEVNAVKLGEKLLGKNLSEHAANKAYYATKQMNMSLVQSEACLMKIEREEQKYAEIKKQNDTVIEAYKEEIASILDSI